MRKGMKWKKDHRIPNTKPKIVSAIGSKFVRSAMDESDDDDDNCDYSHEGDELDDQEKLTNVPEPVQVTKTLKINPNSSKATA